MATGLSIKPDGTTETSNQGPIQTKELLLVSSNGTKYAVTISDLGVLVIKKA